MIFFQLESDSHGVAAFDLDEDRGRSLVKKMVEEGRGDDAGSTCQGLVLDAAFIGADCEGAVAANGGEVGVGAFWGEVGVVTQIGAEAAHVGAGKVLAEYDGVRDAGVDGVDGEFAGGDWNAGVGLEGMRHAHLQADPVAEEFGLDFAGESLKADF